MNGIWLHLVKLIKRKQISVRIGQYLNEIQVFSSSAWSVNGGEYNVLGHCVDVDLGNDWRQSKRKVK